MGEREVDIVASEQQVIADGDALLCGSDESDRTVISKRLKSEVPPPISITRT